jgi:hypothetical protein
MAFSFLSTKAKRKSNDPVELALMLKFAMNKIDEGISCFWANHKEHYPEVSLFILLWGYLSGEEMADYWVREYESAVKRGIKPRERLQQDYAKIIATR